MNNNPAQNSPTKNVQCINCNKTLTIHIYSNTKICESCWKKGIRITKKCICCNPKCTRQGKPFQTSVNIKNNSAVCPECIKQGFKNPDSQKTKTVKCFYCNENTEVKRNGSIKCSVCLKCAEKGLKNPQASINAKKASKAFQKKYGENVICPMDIPGAKEKVSKTLLKTFSNKKKREEIVNQRKKTNLKRTGYDVPAKNPEIRVKMRIGCKKTTGKEYVLQSPQIIKKINMIKCLECGKELKMVTAQHLQCCSNIALDEYKKKHPDALIIDPSLKKYRIENCKNFIGKTKKTICDICGNVTTALINNRWPAICEECRKPKTYKNQIYLEKEDKVICQICWQAFDQITKPHLSMHNISIEEYRKKFPNGLITNKKIREDRRVRILGENNVMSNPEIVEKVRKALTYTLKDYQEKYAWFLQIEEMSENDNGNILVHCKNHNCKNSKEKGGWFIPSGSQLTERLKVLKNSNPGSEGSFLYCSEYCKQTCDLYRKSVAQLIKQDLINAGHIPEKELGIPGYEIFHQEVFKRNIEEYGKLTCEYCGNINKYELCVHHENPQKTHPEQILDPINGWVLCGFGKGNNCHYLLGHKPGTKCSIGNLSKLICTRKLSKRIKRKYTFKTKNPQQRCL